MKAVLELTLCVSMIPGRDVNLLKPLPHFPKEHTNMCHTVSRSSYRRILRRFLLPGFRSVQDRQDKVPEPQGLTRCHGNEQR